MFEDLYLVTLSPVKDGSRMYLCVLAYYPQEMSQPSLPEKLERSIPQPAFSTSSCPSSYPSLQHADCTPARDSAAQGKSSPVNQGQFSFASPQSTPVSHQRAASWPGPFPQLPSTINLYGSYPTPSLDSGYSGRTRPWSGDTALHAGVYVSEPQTLTTVHQETTSYPASVSPLPSSRTRHDTSYTNTSIYLANAQIPSPGNRVDPIFTEYPPMLQQDITLKQSGATSLCLPSEGVLTNTTDQATPAFCSPVSTISQCNLSSMADTCLTQSLLAKIVTTIFSTA